MEGDQVEPTVALVVAKPSDLSLASNKRFEQTRTALG